MVLVRVPASVGEDEIRGDCLLQFFENRLNLGPEVGHETVAELLQHWPLQTATGEQLSAMLRLRFPHSYGAEYHPVEFAARVLFRQAKNGAATTNFNIVGVTAQA